MPGLLLRPRSAAPRPSLRPGRGAGPGRRGPPEHAAAPRSWRIPLLALAVLVLAPGTGHADEATRTRLVERAVVVLAEAESHYHAGRKTRASDLARQARTLVEQADRLRSGGLDTALLGVQTSVFADDLVGARSWLERYAKRTPYGKRDANLHYAHGLILLFLEGRPGQAVEALDRMTAVSPRGPTRAQSLLHYAALMADGMRLVQTHQGDEALVCFQRATRLARKMKARRKELAARANAGITLQQFGQAAESERVFRALHSEDPESPLWSWYLGRSLVLQERFPEAVPFFEHLAQKVDQGRAPPSHADLFVRAWLELGRSRCGQARRETDPGRRTEALEKARRAFTRFTVLAPDVAEGWFRLGRLLYETFEEPYAAMGPLGKAHDLDPACDGSLRLLIRIAARHGPPPREDAAAMEEAVRAWDQRRRTWEEEMETHADEWEAERRRRREISPARWDGCPE